MTFSFLNTFCHCPLLNCITNCALIILWVSQNWVQGYSPVLFGVLEPFKEKKNSISCHLSSLPLSSILMKLSQILWFSFYFFYRFFGYNSSWPGALSIFNSSDFVIKISGLAELWSLVKIPLSPISKCVSSFQAHALSHSLPFSPSVSSFV